MTDCTHPSPIRISPDDAATNPQYRTDTDDGHYVNWLCEECNSACIVLVSDDLTVPAHQGVWVVMPRVKFESRWLTSDDKP